MSMSKIFSAAFSMVVNLIEMTLIFSLMIIVMFIPFSWVFGYARSDTTMDDLYSAVLVARALRIPVYYNIGEGYVWFHEDTMAAVRKTSEVTGVQGMACGLMDGFYHLLTRSNESLAKTIIPQCGEVKWSGSIMQLPFRVGKDCGCPIISEKNKTFVLPARGFMDPRLFPKPEVIDLSLGD